MNRLHPRIQFFFKRAGEETEFFAHGNRRAGDDKAAEFTVQHRPLQAGGHSDERFACAGLAHEGDELDAIVKQGVKSKVLLAVAGLDPPNSFARIDNRRELRSSQIDFGQSDALRIALLHKRAVFVGEIGFTTVNF